MSIKYQGSSSLNTLLTLLKSKFDSKPDKKDNIIVGKEISSTWTDSKQTISVDGVRSDSIVDILISSSATDEQIAQFSSLGLKDGGQSDGTITLEYTGTINSSLIPITVIIRGNI